MHKRKLWISACKKFKPELARTSFIEWPRRHPIFTKSLTPETKDRSICVRSRFLYLWTGENTENRKNGDMQNINEALRNKPIDSETGATSSSGTGPGMADGLWYRKTKNYKRSINYTDTNFIANSNERKWALSCSNFLSTTNYHTISNIISHAKVKWSNPNHFWT